MIKKILIIMLLLGYQIVLAATPSIPPVTLKAVEKTLIVDGKASRVFDIIQPDGTEGYIGTKGDDFNVLLKNETTVPIAIHWHGLVLPNDQDGIPYVTQLPIQPGRSKFYHFKILQAGTFWMHSHFKFHEQMLMTAPLILKDPQDPYAGDKDVVVMLQEFTSKDPEMIFFDLQHKKMPAMKMKMSSKPDLNDVVYDAYIANRRTLKNPEIISVNPGEKVRLRMINAASASNFWINTGNLRAKAIAIDGNNITPIENAHFQLAVAQRMDLEVTIPQSGGVFPILAQVEGLKQQTGVILATKGVAIPHFKELADKAAPPLNNDQEYQLHPWEHFTTKPINTTLNYKLSGDMQRYIWKINNEVWPHITPYKIKYGDRIEMTFMNDTGMAHPMHFHGHVFQVTEINGRKLNNGPMRDTILVLPHATEKVIFDANNPGIWMTHCHVLYHMAAGMMTTTNYIDYPEPSYYKQLIKGKIKE